MAGPALRLDAVGRRVQGPDARTAEHDFRVVPELDLALLSTGMGAIGGQGRPSSKLAIWSVIGQLEHAGRSRESLRAGLERADEAISRLFPGGTTSPPGANFAGVLLDPADPGRAIAAHVGAARVYHLRGAELLSVSHDHTLANEAAALEVELDNPALGFVVTRMLGFLRHGPPELRELEVRAGDRFVLCGRHLARVLDESTIVELAAHPSLELALAALLARTTQDSAYEAYRSCTAVVAELVAGEPIHAGHGASTRPPRSWLYAPGEALAAPPGSWPWPDETWFREVYALVMGDDG